MFDVNIIMNSIKDVISWCKDFYLNVGKIMYVVYDFFPLWFHYLIWAIIIVLLFFLLRWFIRNIDSWVEYD